MSLDELRPIIPTLGIVASAVIGAISALTVSFFTRRTESKRQIREIAFKFAIENWKTYVDVALKQGHNVMPIESFIVHSLAIARLAYYGRITECTVRKHLREAYAMSDVAEEEIKKRNEDKTA